MKSSKQAWGIVWNGHKVDGVELVPSRHIIWRDGEPLLFGSRRAAREYVREYYGYIRHREDLRGSPHYWRMPLVQRVTITIETDD